MNRILRRTGHPCALLGVLGVFVLLACPASAILVDDLPPGKEWRTDGIEISGNKLYSAATLRGQMLTETRPWYLFWQSAPEFDPVTFREDLERLRRFYEARGYYGTR